MQKLSPERLLAKTRELHRRAEIRLHGAAVELFHRASSTLRIGRDASDPAHSVHEGFEEGLAVRVVSRDRRVRFAASSGFGPAVLDWLVDRALASPGSPVLGGAAVWAERPGDRRRDHDAQAVLPVPEELGAWLDRSLGQLSHDRGRHGQEPRPLRAWVDTALTVETLVGSGGLAASRSRGRAWALAWVRRDGGGRETHHAVAARGFGRLPEDGWSGVIPAEAGPWVDPGAGRPTLLLARDPAAVVAAALVRALHGPDGRVGFPTGPGWRVVDDPLDPLAILGSTFDDAGFPTCRTELADGSRAIGKIEVPGCLRRASFRDPPQPIACSLRVAEGAPHAPPGPSLRVDRVRIHRAGELRWVLELEGVSLRDEGPAFTAFCEVEPEELARRCVAAVGSARQTYRGVTTPALVFEGLRVRLHSIGRRRAFIPTGRPSLGASP
jgi:hypothetical protein